MTALVELASLPGRAKSLLMASALNNFGSGLVLPLLVAYVSHGLHLDVRYATTAIALTSIGAAVGGPVAGWLADIWGRAQTVWAGLLLATSGTFLYGVAREPRDILLAAFLLGVGVGGNSAWYTMLAESVTESQRSVLFGTHLMVINATLGLGGLIGGLVVHSGTPMSFRILYLANGATFILAGALMWAVSGTAELGDRADHTGTDRADADLAGIEDSGRQFGFGYLAVLRTRGLWPLLLLALLAFLVGYSQLEVAVPGVMLSQGLGTMAVAITFAVNTAVVVLGQFFLLPRLHHRSQLSNVIGVALVWSVGWFALAAVTFAGTSAFSVVLGCLCLGLFAMGECLYGITMPTMINAVATNSNRGRVNGLYSLATSIGFFLGPILSGQLLVDAGPRVLAVALACACAAMALGAMTAVVRVFLSRPREVVDAS
jgi:MFS family permease